MNDEIKAYNEMQTPEDQQICHLLAEEITKHLPEAENKIWHRMPVWFLDGNPVVGYAKLKGCIRLLFWSGQSFNEEKLVSEGSFMASEICYTDVKQIKKTELKRWVKLSRDIQWDYKNIVKRKGKLIRLK